MHIEITRTARRFHLPPDIAQALIEAGLATEVPKEHLAPAKPAPRWAVRKHPLSDRVELVLFLGSSESIYPGPNCFNPTPEHAAAIFARMGHPVPTEVLDNFSALLGHTKNISPDLVNEARLRAQAEQYSREQRERATQQIVESKG